VGPLPIGSVRFLAAGLASALTEIHRAGLIHRDLKPSNVLLTDDGPRVIDFGIARAVEGGSELTHTGSIIGSPGFMSPEQADGRPVTPASDVFSLGALLVMATTGQSPFGGTSTPQVLYNVVHSQPNLQMVPPEVRRLAEPCLAKNPAQRPTPAQILDFLGPVAPTATPWPQPVHAQIALQKGEVHQALSLPIEPVPASEITNRKPRKRALLTIGAFLGVILLAAGTIAITITNGNDKSTTTQGSNSSAANSSPKIPGDLFAADHLRRIDTCQFLTRDVSQAVGPLLPPLPPPPE
jgi:serine/threonine protein kinase